MTEDDEANGLEITRIEITAWLSEEGRMVVTTNFGDDGSASNLVTILGMLRLAEDTAIRDAMGEIPE